jgi:hypothetical protein
MFLFHQQLLFVFVDIIGIVLYVSNTQGRDDPRSLYKHVVVMDERYLFRACLVSKILQNFSSFPSHRIFRHKHEALNIDKK